jgi:signal transduction histidine kinase
MGSNLGAPVVFKNLRTSTKLLLLCGAFICSIMLATISLIQEKLIAIEFVRKELVGERYLKTLQQVYCAILARGSDLSLSAEAQGVSADLKALATAEDESEGGLDIAAPAQELNTAVNALSADVSGGDRNRLAVDALAKAQNLASRIGDESNLTLDPDLDSYYLQNIVVKRLASVLSNIAELHSLVPASPPASLSDETLQPARASLLDGQIRTTVGEIERNVAAAIRRDADDRLKQTVGQAIGSMRSGIEAYLHEAGLTMRGEGNIAQLEDSYRSALHSVDQALTITRTELKRLLNERRLRLLGKLYGSLLLNGLVAGLSILFGVMAYRQIVRPLGQLENLADKVGQTKDYSLRIDLERGDEIGRLATAFNTMLKDLSVAREREREDQKHLASMQAELARVARLTTMGEMAASIAHEINQPLASVVNNANAGMRWLDREPPNVEEVKAALSRIVNDGQRGSDIIGSVRAMVKKGDRSKSRVDLGELINDVMRLIEGQLQRHGVSVQVELANDVPKVLGDRVQLQQVILNLLTNAADAVTCVSGRERLVRVRSQKHNGHDVLIAVEDSGTGIMPDDKRRIFDAFYTTKSEGMGMGLSICRSIVESHGGRITVEDASPCGSVFQIILPGEGR